MHFWTLRYRRGAAQIFRSGLPWLTASPPQPFLCITIQRLQSKRFKVLMFGCCLRQYNWKLWTPRPLFASVEQYTPCGRWLQVLAALCSWFPHVLVASQLWKKNAFALSPPRCKTHQDNTDCTQLYHIHIYIISSASLENNVTIKDKSRTSEPSQLNSKRLVGAGWDLTDADCRYHPDSCTDTCTMIRYRYWYCYRYWILLRENRLLGVCSTNRTRMRKKTIKVTVQCVMALQSTHSTVCSTEMQYLLILYSHSVQIRVVLAHPQFQPPQRHSLKHLLGLNFDSILGVPAHERREQANETQPWVSWKKL